jgi:MFS family permease
MTLACGVLASRITGWVGLRGATIIGCLVCAAANFLVALCHSYQWQLALAGGLAGLGNGLAMACLANAVVASVPETHTSMATGVNANVRTIGGSIGVAAFTSVIAATVSSSGHPTEDGYVSGFVLLGVAALVGGLAGALMPAIKTPVAA